MKRSGGGGGGGLGPHIKIGGKIWGKVRPSSPNKRKNLGSSVTTRRKSWEKIPVLRSYLKFRGQNLGYLLLIFLEAEFGAPTRISEANFGTKPPRRRPNMKVSPLGAIHREDLTTDKTLDCIRSLSQGPSWGR